MKKIHLKTLLRLSLVLGALLVFIFLLSKLPTALQPNSAKTPQSPELAASDQDADAVVNVGSTSPLPDKIPTILLSDSPIEPSPLIGGVKNLPYVPPSPDTKPEFESEPVDKVNSSGSTAAAPNQVLGPMPGPLNSFDGLDFTHNGAGHPPDTNGDVGLTQYMLGVNTSIGIYNKQTSALETSFTFNSFWSGAGTGTACDTSNAGDIVVLYDTLHDRWIFMDFAWTDIQNGPYYFCFGVSQTSDALGNYWRYAIRADDASHAWLPDYPKGGVWPDGLYFSANMFDCLNSSCSSATYEEARAFALNLQKMEAGSALTANDVQAKDTSASYFTLLPSNARRSQPPANTPNYFVGEDQAAYDWDVFKFHVDFSNPANSTLTGPTQVSQESYITAASRVPEPAPGNNIDTLADRTMFLNQYRRINNAESLWVQHTVGTASASTPTGIQWAQIDVSGGTVNTTPVQEQIFNNGADGLNRFMGSMSVDQMGDVALGYSVSSASLAPDIRYVGRLVSDPLGQMPRSEITMLPGVTRSVQTGNCGGSACTRWGDYSAMTVDPVDDCTFWYTNMYFPVQGPDWVTRIGSFRFPTCTSTTPSTTSLVSKPNPSTFGQTVTLTATVSAGLNALVTPSGVVSFTIGTRQPVVANLSNGIATLITNTLPAGTYPITATYGGDANFSASYAVLVPDQTVNKAGTTTSLISNPNPSVFGQTVALTATVGSSVTGLGTPSGLVSFTIGNRPPVTASLSNGIAKLNINTLPAGTYPITATYGGDANFGVSHAVLIQDQKVNKAATSTALALSPGGSGLTITVTVTTLAPGAGIPTGVITVTIDGVTAGTAAVSPTGVVTLNLPLSSGAHTVKASYSGSANFTSSASAVVNLSSYRLFLPLVKK